MTNHSAALAVAPRAPVPVSRNERARVWARAEREKKRRRQRRFSILSNIIYIVVMTAIASVSLFYALNSTVMKSLFGFSVYTVLTSSMESVYPPGTLVLVQQRDAANIQVGDNITFYVNNTTSVTHQVVNAYDNYKDSGQRAFQTKGVDNPRPDDNPVYAPNVAGVVIFSIPEVGAMISFIGENLWLCAIILGSLFILSFALRIFLGEMKRDKKGSKIELEASANEQTEVSTSKAQTYEDPKHEKKKHQYTTKKQRIERLQS